MAVKKWAMVITNAGYDPEKDMACLNLKQVETHILMVRSPDKAMALVKRLGEEGFGAIEVCGAFSEELARKIYETAGCKVPVGYVTTPQDQFEKVLAFRSRPRGLVLHPAGGGQYSRYRQNHLESQ